MDIKEYITTQEYAIEFNDTKDKKCPVCGSRRIVIDISNIYSFRKSIRTGKTLKKLGYEGIAYWGYHCCKCGWDSALLTE